MTNYVRGDFNFKYSFWNDCASKLEGSTNFWTMLAGSYEAEWDICSISHCYKKDYFPAFMITFYFILLHLTISLIQYFFYYLTVSFKGNP